MKHLRIAVLALAGSAALAGCSDDPLRPATDAALARFAVVEGAGNYLVVFRTAKIPSGFAQQIAALGGEVELAVNAAGAASVTGLDAADVAVLRQDGSISYVEPETVMRLPKVSRKAPVAVPDAVPASASNPAGSFFYPRQWNMRAIHADQAWAAGSLGAPGVTVAILDTGIDYTHADLAGRVDLARSESFIKMDNDTLAKYFPGRHQVGDLYFHGTHVAATVASNGLAAAGVTSGTTLIGVKVCGYASGCPGSAIFAGIEWAVEHGADIINMSLGGAFQKAVYPGYVAVLNRLFTWANAQGVVVVVSSGNEQIDLDRELAPNDEGVIGHYPSLYKTYCSVPNVLCVSATGPTAQVSVNGPWTEIDAAALYSNYGRSAIDVAAPGGNYSYVWAACSRFSLIVPICQTGTYVVGSTGTSMAAPHVSGLAAMILAEQPWLTPAQLRRAVTSTADDLGQRGTDPWYGKGRINAARAVGLD